MTPKEKLIEIIASKFANNQAAFARAIKRSPAQVNQWLTGYRNMDVKACRHIEKSLGLHPDYFLSSPPSVRGADAIPYFSKTELSAIALQIAQLVDMMDHDGQMMLLGQARLIAETHPRDKGNNVAWSI